ncbi:5prime-nucleotidase, C-terminal domain [Popillia japonica]|uniref:5'-nucleotidase n=1 Tax=Popillia japonica TaxID=7064 RepID=A0AAW1IXP0_POPJA
MRGIYLQVLVVLFCRIGITYHFQLMILHSNNINFHFEESPDKTGGAGRVMYLLNKYRREAEEGRGPPVLYLNTGDNFSPSQFFSKDSGDTIADYLNILKPDAVCLGNHDLNVGIMNLTRFLQQLQVPVVTANINFGNQQILKEYVKPSRVVYINKHKIGIVGTTTAQQKIPFLPKSISIRDEILSLQKECSKLHKLKVKIVIVISHAGIQVDKMIAKFVDHVDVIVGSGGRYAEGRWQQQYVVRKTKDKYVPIIRDEGLMTSLGMFKVMFNQIGNVIEHAGRLIFLHNKIPQDSEVLHLTNRIVEKDVEFGKPLSELNPLCSYRECSFANYIADTLVDYKSIDYHENIKGKGWTDYPVAMINAGLVRRGFTRNTTISNELLKRRILYYDSYVYLKINGCYIKQAIREGTNYYGYPTGYYLQFSGIHVAYNFTTIDLKHRIINITIRCGQCAVPSYSAMEDNREYSIIVNFLTYRALSVLHKKRNSRSMGYSPIGHILRKFMHDNKEICPEEDDRIRVERAGQLQQDLLLFCIIFIFIFILILN